MKKLLLVVVKFIQLEVVILLLTRDSNTLLVTGFRNLPNMFWAVFCVVLAVSPCSEAGP